MLRSIGKQSAGNPGKSSLEVAPTAQRIPRTTVITHHFLTFSSGSKLTCFTDSFPNSKRLQHFHVRVCFTADRVFISHGHL